ncbi:MAG: PKD domain-containing protein [Saprospiraceae bacterium]
MRYFINLSSEDAVEFSWDLGDGTTSNDPIVAHTYEQAGAYTVTLTITSENGCTNTFTVVLNFAEDSGNFTANPSFF